MILGPAPTFNGLPSLKLTAKAPENGWLEYDSFPFGARPIFRGKLLVLGRVQSTIQINKNIFPRTTICLTSLNTLIFLDAPQVIREKHLKKKQDTGISCRKSRFPPAQFQGITNSTKIPSVLQFLTLHGFFHRFALAQGWLSTRITHRGASISEIPVEPGGDARNYSACEDLHMIWAN